MLSLQRKEELSLAVPSPRAACPASVGCAMVLIRNPECKDSFAFLIVPHISQHKYRFSEISKINIWKKKKKYNRSFKCVLVFAVVS